MISTVRIKSNGQGLSDITHKINEVLAAYEISEGLCTLFIRHTSASLIIQENADPSAKRDLERWLNRLVKEDDSLYTHTLEGPDDMPSHIKSILTSTSIAIPFTNRKLLLGTWQGVYLWEHRHHGSTREIIVHTGA